MRGIMKRCHGDYVILMSESCYPVKGNEYISRYLCRTGKDYSLTTPLPNPNPLNTPGGHWLEGGRRRYECYALRLKPNSIATIEPHAFNIGNLRQFVKVLRDNPARLFRALKILFSYPVRRHPDYLKPCGGDTWFILRSGTTKRILDFCDKHPEYLDYCDDTQCLDEMFVPTMVYNLIPEEERENRTLRYVNWKDNGSSSPADFTMDDQKTLADCVSNPDCLFVRKVQDMKICELIDWMVGLQ